MYSSKASRILENSKKVYSSLRTQTLFRNFLVVLRGVIGKIAEAQKMNSQSTYTFLIIP